MQKIKMAFWKFVFLMMTKQRLLKLSSCEKYCVNNCSITWRRPREREREREMEGMSE